MLINCRQIFFPFFFFFSNKVFSPPLLRRHKLLLFCLNIEYTNYPAFNPFNVSSLFAEDVSGFFFKSSLFRFLTN